MPFVVRPKEDHFKLVVECYVDGIMNGEAVEAIKNGTSHNGLFNPCIILDCALKSGDVPEAACEIIEQLKWGVLEAAHREYDILQDS